MHLLSVSLGKPLAFSGTYPLSEAKHDRGENPEKPITQFEGKFLLLIVIYNFKSNFCILQNHVAFTIGKNTGIIVGHDAQYSFLEASPAKEESPGQVVLWTDESHTCCA